MEDKVFVFTIGTAGSGKSYFTSSFSDYLDFKKIDHAIVNLDPGADFLPYEPDVDVREWITVDDVMEKYNVGPNGAQIVSADLIATKAEDILDELDLYSADYVLVDTPGQMELFTLRSSSEIIIQTFGRQNCVSVFLFDPVISQRASGFTSMVFMYSSAVMRLNIPQIPVLSKADLLPEHDVERILTWSRDADALYDDVSKEKGLSRDLFHLLREAGLIRPLIPVSAKTGEGMDDVYDIVQEIYYGGEDLESMRF
ncbi:MAG: GTPase [Archaeoglobi archaeon]|nr:GTPase [Archaeoglobi archaeon]